MKSFKELLEEIDDKKYNKNKKHFKDDKYI